MRFLPPHHHLVAQEVVEEVVEEELDRHTQVVLEQQAMVANVYVSVPLKLSVFANVCW